MTAEGTRRVCQNPDCDDKAAETYVDRAGNELALCELDYYDAVHPNRVIRSVVSRERQNDGDGHWLKRMFTQ